MTEESFKRKLSAILSADVKGYSHLMQDDEEATVLTITAYRGVMSSLIQEHDGRVVDAKGDNLLAEFPSVVDAVWCGVEIQKELKVKNEDLHENRRMEFRIGINLGDVIEEGNTIYGDGVNIAARLEGLAEGGGICISGTAFDHIGKKLQIGYEYLGEQTVKNIEKPIRAYNVLMGSKYAGKVIGEERPKPKQWRWSAIAVVLIIVAGAFAIWHFYFRPPLIEPASVDKMAFSLPEKPSIAVLPFTNMSGDPNQEYIADGITENIISALSQNSEMFIISSISMFMYKETKAKLGEVSEDLGVRYILEGSVQQSGERIRVNAQLIDAIKGYHLWSERYDRSMMDFFAVQDEITHKIALALQVELTHGERTRSYMSTHSLEAWEYTVKGNRFFIHYTKEDNKRARELFKQATALDPKYAFAWSLLAWTHIIDAWFNFGESRTESFNQAVELTLKALSLDSTIPNIHSSLSFIHLMQGQHEEAVAKGKIALSLSPNDATSHMLLAQTLCFSGNLKEAPHLAKKAMRLSPHIPAWYLAVLGLTYYMAEQYEESLSAYRQLLKQSQTGEITPMWAHIGLVSVYTQLGQEKQASVHAAELLNLDPNFSLNWVRNIMLFKEPSHLDRILNALRRSGLR